MGWNHQLVAGSCYISYLKEISYMFHVSSIPLFGSLLDIGAWNSRAMSRLSSQRELSKSPPPADFKLSPSPNIKNTKTNKQTATMTMMWTRVSSLSGTYATFETYANDGPDHLGFAQNALHRYRLTFIANDHQSHEAKTFGSRGFGVLKNREVVRWMVQATFLLRIPGRCVWFGGEGQYDEKIWPPQKKWTLIALIQ